jgi:hypothetical protein
VVFPVFFPLALWSAFAVHSGIDRVVAKLLRLRASGLWLAAGLLGDGAQWRVAGGGAERGAGAQAANAADTDAAVVLLGTTSLPLLAGVLPMALWHVPHMLAHVPVLLAAHAISCAALYAIRHRRRLAANGKTFLPAATEQRPPLGVAMTRSVQAAVRHSLLLAGWLMLAGIASTVVSTTFGRPALVLPFSGLLDWTLGVHALAQLVPVSSSASASHAATLVLASAIGWGGPVSAARVAYRSQLRPNWLRVARLKLMQAALTTALTCLLLILFP